MSRLLDKYRKEIRPQLMRTFGYGNILQAPKMEKIIINMGVGAATEDPKLLEDAAKELALITGQQPATTRGRKSISNFKLRIGAKIGCRVTLRGGRMYEFLDRFVNVVLPRIKDFRGIPLKSFDGRGNYTLGITEQSVFPELDIDRIKRVQGMDITFVTSSNSDDEAKSLLQLMGMPFQKK